MNNDQDEAARLQLSIRLHEASARLTAAEATIAEHEAKIAYLASLAAKVAEQNNALREALIFVVTAVHGVMHEAVSQSVEDTINRIYADIQDGKL